MARRDVVRCPRCRRYQEKSGHGADVTRRPLMTHLRHDAARCAALHSTFDRCVTVSASKLGAKMKRREFIVLIGGAATAWPLAAHAQSGDRVRRVGALISGSASDPDLQSNARALEKSLQNLGWVAGRNLVIDYRWGEGNLVRTRGLAKELLDKAPDVLLAVGVGALIAFRDLTHAVPIVFARVSDPVGQHLVDNVVRPGGNVTGFSNFEPAMSGKWLQVLKDVAPNITHVAVIANPEMTALDYFLPSIIAATGPLNVATTKLPVKNPDDIEPAIASAADRPNGGLIVAPDALLLANRGAVIAQANKYRLPAIYPFRFYASEGGLVSYGIDPDQQFPGVASYIDRILKGEKPGDMPVQAPTKFQLVINLKTAKTIGLTVPQPMLLLADEVIE
jgi:putative tryptophan/tyrosine transport system substrate-binding protein